jgi:hypothetical protein
MIEIVKRQKGVGITPLLAHRKGIRSFAVKMSLRREHHRLRDGLRQQGMEGNP